MNEVIIYLLKVIAIHGLLYLFYRLFLRKSTRHSLNRTYLLVALVLAFAIPFIELSLPEEKVLLVEETPIIHWLVEPSSTLEQFELVPVKEDKSFSWWSLVPFAFGVVTLILLTRSIVYLAILQKLKKHSEPIKKRWFTLFRTTHDRPFSFFRNVFMPRDLFGSDSFRQVLAHECVHVRQLHSVDRLLLDFVVSLFWFNPFIYMYRSALIEIHEYQADEAVVERFKDPVGYQEILFSQLQSPQYSGLVSHFNVEMIKKRIVMMNKPKKRTGWVYLLTVPVTLMIVFAFSSKEAMQPLSKVGNELSGLIGPVGDVKSYAESLFVDEEIPSISPIRNENLIRLASGFGLRTHPILKQRKFHKGLDFSCPIGTPVLVTADGKVIEVKDEPFGYGKMLLVDHGDGIVTRYAHLSKFNVDLGDEVVKGQEIALSGNSGSSSVAHLHYEVIKDGEELDPKDFIKDLDFKLVIKGGDQQDTRPSILPFKDVENARLTSGFGMRMHPIEKVRKHHFGVDFACKVGTEIIATADGIVEKVEPNRKGYGNLLTISHGDQYQTKYAQLSEFKVKEGEKVKKGQVVALSGNSGMSTAPHLHYEVLKDGKRVNPKSYISNYKFALLKEIPPAPPVPPSNNEDKSLQELEKQERELARQLEAEEQLRFKEAYAREVEEKRAMESQLAEEQARMKEREMYELEKMRRTEEKMMEEMRFAELEEARKNLEEGALQNDVLYILDGEEVDDLRSSVNPEDIESVEVLKDQKARDLYGKKGKNGVVIVNTKNKDKGKNKSKDKLKHKDKQKNKQKQKAFNSIQKKSYRVVIDPGHGGKDHGASSPSGVSEKEISLAIARIVRDHFMNESRIEVILTREEDTFLGLKDRSNKTVDADLFISLHTDNYSGKGSFVVPVYHDLNEYSEQSKRLAKLLASEFESIGKESRVGYSSGYAVLENANCPAVLLNVGWFSDPAEDEYLSSNNGQQEVATQITDAIRLAVL